MAELIWDGKYDKDGRRAAPVRVTLPFQTIETVDEWAHHDQCTLELFSRGPDTALADDALMLGRDIDRTHEANPPLHGVRR